MGEDTSLSIISFVSCALRDTAGRTSGVSAGDSPAPCRMRITCADFVAQIMEMLLFLKCFPQVQRYDPAFLCGQFRQSSAFLTPVSWFCPGIPTLL